jgi:hypothetical protein
MRIDWFEALRESNTVRCSFRYISRLTLEVSGAIPPPMPPLIPLIPPPPEPPGMLKLLWLLGCSAALDVPPAGLTFGIRMLGLRLNRRAR